MAWSSVEIGDLGAAARALAARGRELARARPRTVRFGAPAVVAALGLGAWLVLRPTPTPDYTRDRIDQLFSFTLLTDEFNRLPVERRLELVAQLVRRVEGMSAGESTMLAAFAAGIAGRAREQLEANASRLMIDAWDLHAAEYVRVAPEEREAFLDATFVEFSRLGDLFEGRVRDISDEERLAEGRRQARRDLEQMRSGRAPGAMFGRMFSIMNEDIGGHASPHERVRGAQLMRDMVRHLRGQPLGGGG